MTSERPTCSFLHFPQTMFPLSCPSPPLQEGVKLIKVGQEITNYAGPKGKEKSNCPRGTAEKQVAMWFVSGDGAFALLMNCDGWCLWRGRWCEWLQWSSNFPGGREIPRMGETRSNIVWSWIRNEGRELGYPLPRISWSTFVKVSISLAWQDSAY